MALERSPLDELTGLPLLCVPHEGVIPVLKGLQENGGLFDWDHVFLPKNHPLLTESLGGMATRQSRIQLLHRQEQHIPKDSILGGPPLPITPEAQFCRILPCAAGYIPAQAMDFSSGSLRIVTLTDARRERLRTSGEVCLDLRRPGAPNNITAFVEKHVLAQELEGVTANTVHEFLDLVPDTAVRAKQLEELATLLLRKLASGPAASVEKVYKIGYEGGWLAPRVPRSPLDFICRQIMGKTEITRSRIVASLREKLAKVRERDVRQPTPRFMPQARPLGHLLLT